MARMISGPPPATGLTSPSPVRTWILSPSVPSCLTRGCCPPRSRGKGCNSTAGSKCNSFGKSFPGPPVRRPPTKMSDRGFCPSQPCLAPEALQAEFCCRNRTFRGSDIDSADDDEKAADTYDTPGLTQGSSVMKPRMNVRMLTWAAQPVWAEGVVAHAEPALR